MRKRVLGRQLGRNRNSRKALFRGLVSSLFKYGKITTTRAKAESIKPDLDHLVNLAKEGTTASLRQLFATLGNDKEAVVKIVGDSPKLGDRTSGYARMIRLSRRVGDNAEMVRLEWVEDISKAKSKPKTKEVKKDVVKKS